MAQLSIGGTNYGQVIESDYDASYPCMDTKYKELTWTFKIDKEFDNFNAMIDFENNDIEALFNGREHNVSYGGQTVNDMLILSFKRNGAPPGRYPTFVAEYTVVFSKEDA